MTDESAVTLLRDVDALRRRARSDRWGYWLPLLLLGLLILAAPLVYRQLVFPSVPAGASYVTINLSPTPAWHIPGTNLILMPLRLFDTPFALLRDPTVVAVYWLSVVVVGMAATVVWYRWRGRRVGVETSTRTFVLVGVAGLLFLLGILPLIIDATVISFIGYYTFQTFWISIILVVLSTGGTTLLLRRRHTGRRPAWLVVVVVVVVFGIVVALLSASVVLIFASFRSYAPLLVIAMALLALAAVERSRFFTVVTILFTFAAVLVNMYNIENVAYYLHIPNAGDAQFVALARVLLPSAVLIVGGIIGAVAARKTSR